MNKIIHNKKRDRFTLYTETPSHGNQFRAGQNCGGLWHGRLTKVLGMRNAQWLSNSKSASNCFIRLMKKMNSLSSILKVHIFADSQRMPNIDNFLLSYTEQWERPLPIAVISQRKWIIILEINGSQQWKYEPDNSEIEINCNRSSWASQRCQNGFLGAAPNFIHAPPFWPF